MFDTLLLAVDINDPKGAVKVTEAAVAMATDQSAVLHVLNVLPDEGMSIVSASLDEGHKKVELEKTRERLEAWAGMNIPIAVSTQLHVTRGTVYDQIIKVAHQLNVSGIFVGAHRPEFKDYLMGPNAARVARHASQSVFVIR